MTEYIVDLESLILEAPNEEEAYEKARELISAGEVKICLIEEN